MGFKLTDSRELNLKRKITIFVIACWAVAIILFTSHSMIERMLLAAGFGSYAMPILQWLAGIAIFLGSIIPFGIWAKAISDWSEELSETATNDRRTED